MPIHYDEAVQLALLQSDARRGIARAQRHLANRYLRGRGVSRDVQRGAEWMQRAAEQGLPMAQRDLAGLYEQGLGREQDVSQARAWYARAAAQGDVLARSALVRIVGEVKGG